MNVNIGHISVKLHHDSSRFPQMDKTRKRPPTPRIFHKQDTVQSLTIFLALYDPPATKPVSGGAYLKGIFPLLTFEFNNYKQP